MKRLHTHVSVAGLEVLRVSAADSVIVRRGTAADWAAITLLLERAGLPTTDLAESQPEFTVLAEADTLIGIGGLEFFGDAALLRSVVIASNRRRQGLGADLLAHLEHRAREQGAADLVLLTQTADRFFAAHGYTPIPRATVPEPIKSTAEFRSLCPESALCMSKHL